MKIFRFIPGLLSILALQACGGSGGEIESPEILNEFLTTAAVSGIELNDDGSQPVVEGDWKRYSPDTTWTWQLNGDTRLDYDANVYILDLFALTRSDDIARLHALGRDVICYFSAGTYEFWRPDSDLFSGVTLGNSHIGFADEKWLNFREPEVKKLMINRLNIANAIGCDGVELDNVDAFVNDTGFDITLEEQKSFFKLLANEAHRRNLTVALKNNVEILSDLASYFDLVINEECFEYNECTGYLPVVESGKPLFNAEYTQIHVNDLEARQELCEQSREMGFQTLILPLELDGSFRFSCQ